MRTTTQLPRRNSPTAASSLLAAETSRTAPGAARCMRPGGHTTASSGQLNGFTAAPGRSGGSTLSTVGSRTPRHRRGERYRLKGLPAGAAALPVQASAVAEDARSRDFLGGLTETAGRGCGVGTRNQDRHPLGTGDAPTLSARSHRGSDARAAAAVTATPRFSPPEHQAARTRAVSRASNAICQSRCMGRPGRARVGTRRERADAAGPFFSEPNTRQRAGADSPSSPFPESPAGGDLSTSIRRPLPPFPFTAVSSRPRPRPRARGVMPRPSGVLTGAVTAGSGTFFRRMEQQAARRAHAPKVAGSSPAPATTRRAARLIRSRGVPAAGRTGRETPVACGGLAARRTSRGEVTHG